MIDPTGPDEREALMTESIACAIEELETTATEAKALIRNGFTAEWIDGYNTAIHDAARAARERPALDDDHTSDGRCKYPATCAAEGRHGSLTEAIEAAAGAISDADSPYPKQDEFIYQWTERIARIALNAALPHLSSGQSEANIRADERERLALDVEERGDIGVTIPVATWLRSESAAKSSPLRYLPLHRTEAGWPNCATCDGGGCPDCTDPA